MVDITQSRILIVENNFENIHLVSSVLKKAGYKNLSFLTHSDDIFNTIETEQPDLILLDIVEPSINGFQVCEKIKRNEMVKNIPIILLTEKGYNDAIARGLSCGAVDYIMKPFDSEVVLLRINIHLNIRAQQKQIEYLNSKLIAKANREVSKRISSENKFMAFFNQAKYGVVFIDTQGHFIDVNEQFEKMSGFEKSELVGNSAFEYVHEDDKELMIEASTEVLKNGYKNFDKRIKKADGTYLWANASATLVKDEINSEEFIVSICADVDTRYKLESELKQKEELLFLQSKHAAMGNMIGMIAHQWRQPLNVISIIVNNIDLDLNLDQLNMDDLPAHLKTINENIIYMNQTIDDFRNFFRPNKIKINTTLESICDESLSLINHSLKKNDIEIIKDYQCNEKIQILESELKQIIVNIINNAKDSSKTVQDSKIYIETRKTDNSYLIKISDNAGGIPDDIIDTIGTMYFTTKSDGTGLGIYMSKMILEKHLNGSLKWYNTNEGACFEIELHL